MLVSGIKSRPIYAETLSLDPKGARHLIVARGDAARPVVAEALSRAGATLGRAPVHVLVDTGFVPPQDGPVVTVEPYADPASALARLTGLLDAAVMGIRVYAVGPEQFVWDVAVAADPFGFGKREVAQVVAGSIARRVFCTHCKTMNEGVAENVHPCAGCGRRLLVRDHFSRRLGAFMAVAVDAEDPGAPVDVEILFP